MDVESHKKLFDKYIKKFENDIGFENFNSLANINSWIQTQAHIAFSKLNEKSHYNRKNFKKELKRIIKQRQERARGELII